uniref:Uncharacterized protein n=1 Tax=Parascaris univalens TaxID=6257 RepID=A0A915CGK9_PARUN
MRKRASTYEHLLNALVLDVVRDMPSQKLCLSSLRRTYARRL